ncbi:hypothetical protein [Paracnuella aquatica]|uniref:hypothetical protein n=1 Tax=Paracnuella aquatica TaxID=2268757 RepID=UPI0013902A28|nr:hypothetical protein [Paracnuella aquatica]
MNYLYSRLNKSQITSGLLKEYAIEFNNWDNFTGTQLHDSNFVSLTEWRLLYAGLYSSQITSTPKMLYLDTLNRLLNKYSQPNQPISMPVLYYHYQSIKPTALTVNLLRNENGQLVDVAGRTQSPYDTKEMFAIAPILQATFTGTSQIIFRSDLLLGNTGKTVRTVEVDANGSGAWQTVALNTPFNLTYTTEGFYNINIRITYTDNSQRLGHTKLAVHAKPVNGASMMRTFRKQSSLASATEFRFAPDTYGDNPLEPVAAPAARPFAGASATGQMIIEFARNNTTGQIRKPLIVVEGFDMTNEYFYRDFADELENDFNNRPETPITLNDNLDDIGEYDVIFLNFNNATDFIQRNAFLLEAVIGRVNAEKGLYNCIRRPTWINLTGVCSIGRKCATEKAAQ